MNNEIYSAGAFAELWSIYKNASKKEKEKIEKAN